PGRENWKLRFDTHPCATTSAVLADTCGRQAEPVKRASSGAIRSLIEGPGKCRSNSGIAVTDNPTSPSTSHLSTVVVGQLFIVVAGLVQPSPGPRLLRQCVRDSRRIPEGGERRHVLPPRTHSDTLF